PLAWVIGAEEAQIRRSLPIFWAVILELIASLCMREAFATLRQPNGGIAVRPAGFEARPGGQAAETGGFIQAPLLGFLAPLAWEKVTHVRAMNDNLPLAAYA
ncbi:MAG: hypothetical protein HY765_11600, partial [Rhodomicrobium sp.]|nr:hypothetical protein [Rhodomicrobium sp.]